MKWEEWPQCDLAPLHTLRHGILIAYFQPFSLITAAELTEVCSWDNGPAELLLYASAVSSLLCHPYAALPHSGLYGNGHFPITRPQIPYLHFQKLQFLSKWEAQSTIFKGGHFLPTLSIKCLVTINFYLGNGFSFQSHGLKFPLFEHFLSSCL